MNGIDEQGVLIAVLQKWYPWLAAIVLVGVCLALASNLSATADTRVFLGQKSSGVSELQQFEEVFGRRSTLHFAVSEAPLATETKEVSSDVQVPSELLLELESRLWGLDYVTSVVSAVSTNFPQTTGDGMDVTPIYLLSPEKNLTRALDQPNVDKILVTNDRRWWSLVAEIDLPVGVPGEVLKLDSQLDQLVRDVKEDHPGSDIEYTGELTLMAAFANSAERDNALLVPLSLVVILLFFAFSIRSWRVVLTLAVLLSMSICLSLALRALFGTPTNTATATIPLIILVVVAANAMHYFWALLYRAGGAQTDSKGKLEGGLKSDLKSDSKTHAIAVRNELAWPLAISGFSTAGGFFLLMLASSPPFFEMGWVVGLTLTCSTLLILFWLPVALGVFSREKIGRNSALVADISSKFFLAGRNPKVFGACVATFAISLFGLGFISLDDDFTAYFPENSTFSKNTRAVEAKFGGPDYLEVVQSLKDASSELSADPDSDSNPDSDSDPEQS